MDRAAQLVDIAADEIAEEYPEISADGVDPERAGALILVEEIGDDRDGDEDQEPVQGRAQKARH